MLKKSFLGLALLALVVVPSASLAGGGSSAGGGGKVTTLTIRTGQMPGKFLGKVKSDAGKCQRNRRVRIFQKLEGPDLKIGSDRSNSEGRWRDQTAAFSGSWYAKVRRVVKGGTVCLADRSQTVSAG